MIKRLKRKMLLVFMFFVTLILVGLVVMIQVIPMQQSKNEARNFLQQMSTRESLGEEMPPESMRKTEGKEPPEMPQKENMFRMSSVLVANVDAEGQLLSWGSNRADLYEDEFVETAVAKLVEGKKSFGVWKDYYYLICGDSDGKRLLLMENSAAFENFRNGITMSMIAAVAAWVFLLILGNYMIKKMIQPVDQAFEKQRQFIADAEHELKTPVAVIMANAEVLEAEQGESKWLDYIQTEARRMDKLIKTLMTLAKLERTQEHSEHEKVDFGEITLGTALPFESLAFERTMQMEVNVPENIWVDGNRERLEQLVSVFLSNAVRYGKEHGVIKVELKKQHKFAVLSIYNTGQGVQEEEMDKIFQRFYRVDKARSRQENHYGLGLSIAQTIAEEHRAKIEAEGIYGEYIEFRIKIPLVG